jgi:hypothetical protein
LNIFLLYGCSADNTSNPQANKTPGTGSFACSLSWPHDDPAQENTTVAARAVNCDSAGIDAVVFSFYQSDELVDRYYFECEEHYGYADGLPVGSDYRVEITAEDVDGNVLYQGKYGPFEIKEDITTRPEEDIPMELAGSLAAIVGSWMVDYYYDCETYEGTMIITLNDDFTFASYEEGFGYSYGTWSLWGNEIEGMSGDGVAFYGTFYGDYLDGDMEYGLDYWCWEGYPYDINLTGMQYPGNSSFSVDQDVLVWGQSVDVNWAIVNSGTQAIPAGNYVYVGFFLSEDAAIDINDEFLYQYYLSPIDSNGLNPGEYIWETTSLTLPTDSPFASSSGTFYIGMIVDVWEVLPETNEDDNAGTGSGIDYVPVNIDYFY